MASLLNMSGGSLLNKGLPYDAEIEYLESSGTQYIDTGITPDSDTVANIDIRIYSENSGVGYFGSRVVNGDRFQILDSIGIGQGYYKSTLYPKTNIDYKISLHGTGRVFINDTEVNSSHQTFTPISSFNYSIYCFGANQGDSSILLGRCRIYSVLIKKNDIDVLNLIPVVKDGVGYMYDKVSGQLFGNAGTGAFILGADKQ